ncbi:MAG: hypothetical protein GYA52_00540 [Chloroflexi bacterium]|nr:hypothetical protein [Chloroflexota bacterium]
MKKLMGLGLLILIGTLTACSTLFSEPTPTPTPIPPTSTPIPTPTATPLPPSAWEGTWTAWAGTELLETTIEIKRENGNFVAIYEPTAGNPQTINAIVSDDELLFSGTWQSAEEESGTLKLRMMDGNMQFVGNQNGYIPICGAKEGATQPDPCGLNWSGEWQVWLGPDQYNSSVTYTQNDQTVTGQAKSAEGYRYDFRGTINEDGSIVTGSWSAVILKGDFEVYMDDNMIQFVGNLDGEYPICGARWGASKPEVCLGP